MATAAESCRAWLVGVACKEVDCRTSSAVTFCLKEHSLPLESLSSTTTRVGWLAVADHRPRPLTR